MFTKEITSQRIQRALAALKEFDIDMWISIGRESHFTVEPALLYLLPADVLPICGLILTKEGDNICLAGRLEGEEMEAYSSFSTVEIYGTLADFEEKLTEIISRCTPNGRIALNFSDQDPSSDGLSYTQYKRLKSIFEKTGFHGELVSSHQIVKRMRAQKSADEIAKIEATVLEAMKIYEAARTVLKKGMSGADIQAFFQEKVRELGADFSWGKTGNPFVSVGTRSSYLCKRPPADVFVEGGDLVNVDFGLRIDGFASDDQRSFYALKEGETAAPQEVQKAFEAVQAAIIAAAKVMKPGVHTTALSGAANKVFIENGYPAVRGFGHELGTYAHEGGLSCATDANKETLDNILEEGMVFTMEPAIITSYGRLCQEEVVVVTKDGGRFLSVPQKELWLI